MQQASLEKQVFEHNIHPPAPYINKQMNKYENAKWVFFGVLRDHETIIIMHISYLFMKVRTKLIRRFL